VSSVAAEPWRPSTVWRLVGVNVAALGVLVLCWWGVAGEVLLADQVTWLNVAVLTLVLAGIANALGIAAARRAVTGRARVLLAPGHPRVSITRWERPT
jgi:hypothetical protein